MELKIQLQIMWKDNLGIDDYAMCIKESTNNLGAISELVSRRDLILYAISILNFSLQCLYLFHHR